VKQSRINTFVAMETDLFESMVGKLNRFPAPDPKHKKGEVPMRRKFLLLMAVLSLVFANFACSVLGAGDADNDVKVESPQVNQPESGQPPKSIQPESDQAPMATEVPEFEEVRIDSVSLWDMGEIQSYRGDFTMIFDGTSELGHVNGSIIMNVESTHDPPRQHTLIKMDGYDLDLGWGDFSKFEFYIIEGTVYFNYGDGGDWITLTSDLEDLLADEFVSPENFIDFPEKAMRKWQPEDVNGVNAWHYVLDETDFSNKYNQYDDVTGDVWIAVDGGYVVKVDVSMTGTFSPNKFGDQPVDQGTIRYSYNLRDVNENFAIVLPGESASHENTPPPEDTPLPEDTPSSDGQDEEVVWAREDIPLPADAKINYASGTNITAYSQHPFDEVVEFFERQLPANGWAAQWENHGTKIYNGGFAKGGESLTLNLLPDRIHAGRVSITITIGQ
jgi:hypothetical protein